MKSYEISDFLCAVLQCFTLICRDSTYVPYKSVALREAVNSPWSGTWIGGQVLARLLSRSRLDRLDPWKVTIWSYLAFKRTSSHMQWQPSGSFLITIWSCICMMYGHVMSHVQLPAVLPRAIRPRLPHHRNFALCDIESTSHVPSYTSPHSPTSYRPPTYTSNQSYKKQHLICICSKRVHFIPTKFINDSTINAGQSDGI